MQKQIGVLLILAAAVGCGPRKPTSVEVDPALAALVSSDTVALTGVKLDALRATPLYQKFLAQQFERLAKEGGAGLDKDVVELLAVSNGKDAAVFAKGKSGVFRLDSKEPPPRSKGAIPVALLKEMRTIPPRNQIWAAGIGSGALLTESLPESGNLANLRNLAAGLESYAVGMDLSKGLKLEANCVYRADTDAKRVHDGLRGLVAIGRLSTPKDAPELLSFYDGIQIGQQTNALKVTADIPADALQQFLERLRPSQP